MKEADTKLAADEQRAVRDAIERSTEATVAATYGVSRQALLRAALGLPVRRGTVTLIRAGMAALSTAPTVTA